MNTPANVSEVIAQLESNIAENAAKVAAASGFVIMWNGTALRTDGARVSMTGPNVYADPRRAFMVREAAKFQAAGAARGADSPATVHTAAEAAEIIRREGAALVEVVRKANA